MQLARPSETLNVMDGLDFVSRLVSGAVQFRILGLELVGLVEHVVPLLEFRAQT